MTDEELHKTLLECKTFALECEIVRLASLITPDPDYRQAVARNLLRLRESILRAWSSRKGIAPPVVDTFGAFEQDTNLRDTDFDISVRMAPGVTVEERESFAVQLVELWRSEQCIFANVLDFLASPPAHTAASRVELSTPSTLKCVAAIFVGTQDEPTAAGPAKSFLLDSAIKSLCNRFELASRFVRLVKLWAGNNDLADQHQGYIHSPGWALISLFFLQTQKYVPSLNAISKGLVPPTTAPPLLSVLIPEFFKFLASRESSAQQGLSVARGEEFQAPASGKLFLEDPVEWQKTGQHKNLLEGLGETQWARTLEEAKKAAERLAVSATRSRWFHWAEVFDPRDVPLIKMQRMPAMT